MLDSFDYKIKIEYYNIFLSIKRLCYNLKKFTPLVNANMLPHCSKKDDTLFPRQNHTYELDFKIPYYVEFKGYGYGVSGICFMNVKKKMLNNKDNCCDALYINVECWLCNIKIIKELGFDYGSSPHERYGAFCNIRIALKNDHMEKHKNILEFYDNNVKIESLADYEYGGRRFSSYCKLCDNKLHENNLFKNIFHNIPDHFRYCSGAIDEIARNAHKENQEKDNILSIIESHRKTGITSFSSVSIDDPVYEYVFSWKKCNCGDAYDVKCKICNNTFKSAYIGRFLYSSIISRHIKKKNIRHNYRDLIINTTREVKQYEKDEEGDIIYSANIKLGGYKCIICGILYGSGVSEIPDEEIVLAHFAACSAANASKLYDEGRICALKYVRFA